MNDDSIWQDDEQKECCPKFEPEKWDDKVNDWTHKRFIKTKVATFLYMPVGFGSAMTKLQKLAEHSEGESEESLCLSSHKTKWSMDVYLEVTKEIADAENISMSGKFYSKVYEGPYRNTGKWMEDFDRIMLEKNYEVYQYYTWYVYCPKCAKKYKKNYVVIFGEIE